MAEGINNGSTRSFKRGFARVKNIDQEVKHYTLSSMERNAAQHGLVFRKVSLKILPSSDQNDVVEEVKYV